MHFSLRLLAMALVMALAVGGCGRTVVFPKVAPCVFDGDCEAGLRCVNQQCRVLVLPDGGPRIGGKRFGEPCDAGSQCDSEYCVGGPAGAFCSRVCETADAGCPSSYECKSVPQGTLDAGRAVALCTVPQPLLCQACTQDAECGASGADLCLSLDGGSFCGRDCTQGECPDHFECAVVRGRSKQCVPVGRTCDCSAETVGLRKSCRGGVSPFGRCLGSHVCQADGGFSQCDAPPALQETCNGVDDDCNGAIDDFAWPQCSKTVGSVTCRGPQVCFASAGLVCTAREPDAEACNYEDDDCNGRVDDVFVDARGVYNTVQHCGACGNDCLGAIAHAAAVECDASGAVPHCRATQCSSGYFPSDDASMCLELPDTLCRPCQGDADCVGPGSRCVTLDGAKVCGRDCGPSSPYPPGCPPGYSCLGGGGDGGVAQCLPTTGTCTCRTSTLGSTRSCRVSTCRGFERCAAGAEGPTWTACDIDTYNPEICDGVDNNCSGGIDEGFRNPSTGRYDAAQHCGFCNNDCTKYFSPVLQHTSGVCDAAAATPQCIMGPCLTTTEGSVTFEWVNVNQLSNDGCECRRVQGNLQSDLPDRGWSLDAGAFGVDENCDGIDGVLGDAVFVSATALPEGNGSRTAPFSTIGEGLSAMQTQGKKYVLVAQGLYRENLRLLEGAQLFGGYASDFLKRDPHVHTSFLRGVEATATALGPIHAEALGQGSAETVVSGFTILGFDVSASAAEGADGAPSVAVYLKDVGPAFVLEGNDVVAGRGGAGGRGATGAQGFGRQASSELTGARGQDSAFSQAGNCRVSDRRAGGAAGLNSQCASGNGSSGGSSVCPVYTFAGHQGQQQQHANLPAGSREGAGGWDWSFDAMSGSGCGHVTESGYPTAIQQHDGEDGKPGGDGVGGAGGAGAAPSARYGSLSGGLWVAAGVGASNGQAGGVAQGGGGAGAGGGVARFVTGGCVGWEIGAAGGGGGAGGCGGTGGLRGGAGGASIALLLVSTAASTNSPTIRNNRFQRALGGNGGVGGFGGAGGLGGAGGFGGSAARWSSSVGGKGGEGGNGGPGGGGGGGAGGLSVALLISNVSASGIASLNSFLTPESIDTGGPGGAGGSSPGVATSTGGSGTHGAFANVLRLDACATGCGAQASCDANGVCIPN